MYNILIHACSDRMWYVDEYLIPRICELFKKLNRSADVRVYNDDKGLGNRKAFIESIDYLERDKNTWHLQDDVWPSSQFAKAVIFYEDIPGIICGFGTRPSCRGMSPGWTTAIGMYTSFQCIRIPYILMIDFKKYVIGKYGENIDTDKWDDALFREYILRFVPYYPTLNLTPSIVEHVDFLIGGSIINSDRPFVPRAIEFDEKSFEELKRRLERRAIDDEEKWV